MTASRSPDGSRISRRLLLQGAGALGLSAASTTWLRAAPAPAAPATRLRGTVPPEPMPTGSADDHLRADYRPSQPTGWPPQQHSRNGVGVTIGGHVASVPFTFRETAYEISLLAFGQAGDAPDPAYEGEPSDPTLAFKDTLQKAWGAYYSFRYIGGLSGESAISVQSYSVLAAEPSATQLTFGGDLFIVYEPDPASGDPPITADLRWIEVSSFGGGKPSTEFAQRGNPYYFPGGLTSVYGRPACSFYGAPVGSIADPGSRPSGPSSAFSVLSTAESFLALDTRRKDHAGKGIIEIYGGVKWGWQVHSASS